MCLIGSFVKMVELPRKSVVSVVREFNLRRDGTLRSLFHGTYRPWQKKANNTDEPHRSGEGGFWAYNDRKAMGDGQCGDVVVRVHAYGIIAVHEHGIRASHMDLVGILDVRKSGKRRAARALAKRYGLRLAPSLRGDK